MKKIFYTLTAIILFASCKTSKDYLSKADEDRTFFDVVKRLNKHNADENATIALPILYEKALKRHQKKITIYNAYTDISKWDKLESEYEILQNMFEALNTSATAGSLVTAQSFQNEINNNTLAAAEAYYQQGIVYLAMSGRENAKKAFNSFKKSNTRINGYKDANAKKDQAYNNATINVIINPIIDNSFFFNTGWGNTGYNFSNEYFQQNLVRDLGGTYANRYPARFYTEWEARRENTKPDWITDLILRNIDIPRPSISASFRKVNKKIEVGKDTSGHIIYETVYASLNIQKQTFTARAQMDVIITDASTKKIIGSNTYNEDYRWEESFATYTGDSRALSNSDWTLINNKNYTQPRKEDVLNELYRKIYPQVKNNITYRVDW